VTDIRPRLGGAITTSPTEVDRAGCTHVAPACSGGQLADGHAHGGPCAPGGPHAGPRIAAGKPVARQVRGIPAFRAVHA